MPAGDEDGSTEEGEGGTADQTILEESLKTVKVDPLRWVADVHELSEVPSVVEVVGLGEGAEEVAVVGTKMMVPVEREVSPDPEEEGAEGGDEAEAVAVVEDGETVGPAAMGVSHPRPRRREEEEEERVSPRGESRRRAPRTLAYRTVRQRSRLRSKKCESKMENKKYLHVPTHNLNCFSIIHPTPITSTSTIWSGIVWLVHGFKAIINFNPDDRESGGSSCFFFNS
jgi:hypothetical protein